MSENKRGIKQVGPHSFLFYINPKVYYYLSFEIIESLKVQIYLIKIMETETYIYESIIQFNKLGTGAITPQEAIQKISFLILNFDFIIKEESFNKIILSINSICKARIELFLYNRDNRDKDSKKGALKKEFINNMKIKIHNLLNTIGKQEQKINELKNKENAHNIVLTKLEKVINTISAKLDDQKYNNKGNNSERKNNKNCINQNQYNTFNNNQFEQNSKNKTMVLRHSLNLNNFNSIKTKNNIINKPFIQNNMNAKDLLTRPQNEPSQQIPNSEEKRAINLDKIKNYKP